MFKVIFYETKSGESPVWDMLEELRKKGATNKNARIQHKQIAFYIQQLQDNGNRLSTDIAKHLDEDIWELRPGGNRILYFFFKDNTFVLLHAFPKKTQTTPPREIAKAKAERNDWISRH